MAGLVAGSSPIFERTVAGEYRTVAHCFYDKIDETYKNIAKRTDLPETNSINIDLAQDGVRYWRTVFVSEGASRTKVTVIAPASLYGHGLTLGRIEPILTGCSG